MYSIVEREASKGSIFTFVSDLPEQEEQLRKLSEKGGRPNGGGTLVAGSRQVNGCGVFCSLDGVAEYHAAELIECYPRRHRRRHPRHHRRIAAALERHRKS
jgi:hypothetical protein